MPLFSKPQLERVEHLEKKINPRFDTSEEMRSFAPKHKLEEETPKFNLQKSMGPHDEESGSEELEGSHDESEEVEELEEPEGEFEESDDDDYDEDYDEDDEGDEGRDEEPEGLEESEDAFGFNIADHLKKIQDILSLLITDLTSSHEEGNSGVMSLMNKMMNSNILDSLPLSGVALSPEHKGKLDGIRGKITMMTGKKEGDSPMHVDEKVINLGDKPHHSLPEGCNSCEEDLEDVSHDVGETIAAMSQIQKRFASANSDTYIYNTKEAFDLLVKCADNPSHVNELVVSEVIRYLNPEKYATTLDKKTKKVISGLISDLTCYSETAEFFENLSERLKYAYHSLLPQKTMLKKAFYETRGDGGLNLGYNMCPKYKTFNRTDIPVSWTFCGRDCIEGKTETDGSVLCRYAYWLENVADSHAKVMNKLDVQKNPNNEDMNLRLPDGKRAWAPRGYMKGTELRMEEADIRGREWDNLKTSKKTTSGAPGKMLNYESLLDEVLTSKDIHRHETGYDQNTEAKLKEINKKDEVDSNTEARLYNKKDKGKEVDANVEKRLLEFRESFKFDTDKLMDELLEQAYPRKDSIRPTGE
jgi:hypothetical protein